MNIQSDINYVSESISLLRHIGTQKPYRTSCEDTARRLCPNPVAFLSSQKDILVFLEKVENQVQAAFKEDMEELLYYFAPVSDGEHRDCLARILLLWDEYRHPLIEDFDTFSSALLEMEEEAYYSEFSVILQGFDETIRDSSQFLHLEEPKALLSYILKLNFPHAICLKIEDGLIHYRKHLGKVLDYLSRTIAIIRIYEEEMQSFISRMKQYWEDLIGTRDFLEYLADQSDSLRELSDNPYGYLITPEIFSPFLMGISTEKDHETGGYSGPVVLPIGILYGETCPADLSGQSRQDNYSEEFCLNALKQLSDKNRFEILATIKETPAFGNELAARLNLTTATISHHMTQLMNSGLAEVEQRGTRMYYHSNQAVIRNCFDYVKRELL